MCFLTHNTNSYRIVTIELDSHSGKMTYENYVILTLSARINSKLTTCEIL